MKRAFRTSKPLKMWIDGKCFEIRHLPQKAKKSHEDEGGQQTGLEFKYEINSNEEGKLFTSFRLPQVYYAKLVQFPDFNLKTLEDDTNTTISVPRNGNLVITGETEATISKARDEIHSVVGAIRDHIAALQFISIPILGDEVRTSFTKFKDEILNGDKIQGMDPSIFISPLKLHLTVVVFALLDDHEKSEATQALREYKEKILDPLIEKIGPLKLKISGIDCMKSNYKRVDVLYAKAQIVEEKEGVTLQKIVNDLSDHFYERGLVRTYQDNVKLHMTLINTKYRNSVGTPKKRWIKRQSFDATTIMERFKDYDFGECNVDSIHLSLMGSVGDDGFYKPISVISVS